MNNIKELYELWLQKAKDEKVDYVKLIRKSFKQSGEKKTLSHIIQHGSELVGVINALNTYYQEEKGSTLIDSQNMNIIFLDDSWDKYKKKKKKKDKDKDKDKEKVSKEKKKAKEEKNQNQIFGEVPPVVKTIDPDTLSLKINYSIKTPEQE